MTFLIHQWTSACVFVLPSSSAARLEMLAKETITRATLCKLLCIVGVVSEKERRRAPDRQIAKRTSRHATKRRVVTWGCPGLASLAGNIWSKWQSCNIHSDYRTFVLHERR